MQQLLTITLVPSEASDGEVIKDLIAQATACKRSGITGFKLIKRSIDARGRKPLVNLTVQLLLMNPL